MSRLLFHNGSVKETDEFGLKRRRRILEKLVPKEHGQVLKKIKIIQYWIWNGFLNIFGKKVTTAQCMRQKCKIL